ncbi:MAG: Nramp family divalent metal transporter [Candidatus Sericytochromatia bacterium]|nr:Nramp family divalent metal transporter [Candidatus Tanganyikabacteria bacterium]
MPGTGRLTAPEQDTEALISIKFNKRRWLLLLATLGPGLLSAAAGNDAGGIATYATGGAMYGYALLWVMVVVCVAMAMIQEMCARMGAVTGKGLSSLIRERFGIKYTVLGMLALLVANGAVVISEFAGVAAAAELLGVTKYVAVPAGALLVWLLVVRANYERVERVLMGISMLLLTYVVAAFLAKPDWSDVLHGLTIPQFPAVPAGERPQVFLAGYVFLVIAVIGTTISPWMQFFLQSSIVDKGLTMKNYRFARLDALVGSVLSIVIACFIIVATAAALYYPARVPHHLHDAADAAKALAPVVGHYAEVLFAVGLLGASLLAAAVVPLSTAYAVCEAFGWENGLSKDFEEAPAFMGLFTILIVAGALVVLWPHLPLVRVMVVSHVINGILLPVILVFMLGLVNDRRLMGPYVNGRWYNVVVWGLTGVIVAMALLLVVSSFWPA